MQIVGMKPYRFTPEGSREEISGFTVWALDSIEAGKGVGRQPVKLGMNGEVYEQCVTANGGIDKLMGREVDMTYNRYGRPVGLTLVK